VKNGMVDSYFVCKHGLKHRNDDVIFFVVVVFLFFLAFGVVRADEFVSYEQSWVSDTGEVSLLVSDVSSELVGFSPICGNNRIEGFEVCDGDDLGGLSCSDFGFSQGSASCDSDCNVVLSGCSNPSVSPPSSGGGYFPDFCGDGICSLTERFNNSCSKDCNKINLTKVFKELSLLNFKNDSKAKIVAAQDFVVLGRLSDDFVQGKDAWMRVIVLNYLGEAADVDGVVLKVRDKRDITFSKPEKKGAGAFQFDFSPLNISVGVHEAQFGILLGTEFTASDPFPLIVNGEKKGFFDSVAEFFDSVWSFFFGKS